MENKLKPIQIRILGCLIEKQHTTPDQYPLTLNALKNACNQKTNREPVVSYHDGELGMALNELEGMHLVSKAWSARSPKYEQKLQKVMELASSGLAVLCILMLRGPQTAGEIRAHTHRLHQFDDIDDVEYVLKRLAERSPPLTTQLPRQPGQKEERYAHLLSGEPVIPAAPAAARLTESPLEQRVSELETTVAQLQERIQQFETDV